MLYKKELEEYPALPYPHIKKAPSKYSYAANAEVVDLERSGRVLIVDFFKQKSKSHVLRFCSNNSTWQTAQIGKTFSWSQKTPYKLLSNYVPSTEEAQRIVDEFLTCTRSFYCSGILQKIAGQVENGHRQAAQTAWDNKEALRKKHFAMYPDLPVDLPDYCDKQVFDHGYLFLSKVRKDKKRDARCSECGGTFTVEKGTVMGDIQPCPLCGARVKNRGDWFGGGMLEKSKICIADNVDSQLLLRWVNVERNFTFPDLEKTYSFDPFAYNLYLNTEKGPQIYYYRWRYGPYGSAWWWRGRLGEFGFDSTFLYTRNLDKVFGRKYYNVDLKAGLDGRRSKIPFCLLLNNLRDCPEAEYLFKLGLPRLAAHTKSVVSGKAERRPTFQNMMGVSKQLLPLYRMYDVTPSEHRIIKAWGKWVRPEDFEAFRALGIKDSMLATGLISQMSFPRFVSYFTQQKARHKSRKIDYLMMKYRDYLKMSSDIGVDMSHKSVKYPADCVEAHNTIQNRVEIIKAEKDNERFRAAIASVYEALGDLDFQKAGYCIVLPQSRNDFILEGQALNHCVGKMSCYYENHMKGTRMIFFVRRQEIPDKPFFTMEVDMPIKRIVQLYGFGDSTAPKDVRMFAESFVRNIGRVKMKAAG